MILRALRAEGAEPDGAACAAVREAALPALDAGLAAADLLSLAHATLWDRDDYWADRLRARVVAQLGPLNV